MDDEKQLQLDKRYLRMARIWAENSYCVRRQVGALVVKDKRIISDGYNGTPVGFENVCEEQRDQTIRVARRSQCHNETGTFAQLKRGSNRIYHGFTMYRMLETAHPGRNKTSGLWREIPVG